MTDMRRLGELHIQSARLRALRLHAYTTAVFPGEWIDCVNEDATTDLLEFGYHAYRINELCDLKTYKFRPIDGLAVNISEGDPGNWLAEYQKALNALRHAQSYTFGNAHADHRTLFVESTNLMPMYVKIATDQRDEKTISILGITHCFLNEVIPLVKLKFAGWRF